jgi:Flp pilus assembly protein TadG
MALMLPVMAFILVATIDFARVNRIAVAITWCARDGAAYGSANAANSLNTAGIQTAALADAASLSPQPTITSTTGSITDSGGTYTYVDVTATCTFSTIATYPGIPSTYDVSRTVRMQVSQ